MEVRFRRVSRREFLRYASLAGAAGAAVLVVPGGFLGEARARLNRPKNPNKLTDFEKQHVPMIQLPPIAEDGSSVPIAVSLRHPMEPDHYIKSIEIIAYKDPITNKGKFYLTPSNGKAYVYTQIRLQETQPVVVIAECNKHGRWMAKQDIKVTVGGC